MQSVLHTEGRDTSIGSEAENELTPCMQESMSLRTMKKRKRNRAIYAYFDIKNNF